MNMNGGVKLRQNTSQRYRRFSNLGGSQCTLNYEERSPFRQARVTLNKAYNAYGIIYCTRPRY